MLHRDTRERVTRHYQKTGILRTHHKIINSFLRDEDVERRDTEEFLRSLPKPGSYCHLTFLFYRQGLSGLNIEVATEGEARPFNPPSHHEMPEDTRMLMEIIRRSHNVVTLMWSKPVSEQ